MMRRPRDKRTSADKREVYQKLIEDIKAMIEDRCAVKLDISERNDPLSCAACGAGRSGRPGNGADAWIIIDARQREYLSRGRRCRLKTYSFICLACGCWQTGIFKRPVDS